MRADVVRSLILTDHHFTCQELSEFGKHIKDGNVPMISPDLERTVSEQIDDATLAKLVIMSDPVYREKCRKRERKIIWLMIAAILGGIVWMLYRLVVG
jgi:hypothetical protein